MHLIGPACTLAQYHKRHRLLMNFDARGSRMKMILLGTQSVFAHRAMLAYQLSRADSMLLSLMEYDIDFLHTSDMDNLVQSWLPRPSQTAWDKIGEFIFGS